MNFALTEQQKETQQWAASIAKELIAPHSLKHSREKISRQLLEELSKAGLMTLTVPEKWGGLGLDFVSYALVISEISKACGSVGVTVAVTNMIAQILVREGSPYHQQEFLTRLTSGRALTASFCLTENSSGSDASALKTRAFQKPEGTYSISGEKIFVTNGAFSDFYLVMAKTSELEKAAKGVSAFLVSRDQKGVNLGREEDKMGLIGSSTIRMSFDSVVIPQKNLIASEGDGFKVALRALDGGRISVAAQAFGLSRAALEAGIRYSKEREAFGQPLSNFQAIQWKIADAATAISAAELLILRAAWLKDQNRAFTSEASIAKVFATEMAQKVCEEMLQIHGGYGYVKDYPAERYCRDVRVTTLYEGTSEIQRVVIARDLLRKSA